MITKFKFTFISLFILINICAQNRQENIRNFNWLHVATEMPDEWYSSAEAIMVADSVLKYQTEVGGWPKNTNFHRRVNQREMARIKSTGFGATFDNDATTTEMRFLSKMYNKIKDERYREAFLKALDYIFEAQYENGGWPQFYPYRTGITADYASHITYNDNAMVNIMHLLYDIIREREIFVSMNLSKEHIIRAEESFNRGLDCILKTQIVVNGDLTVWCAQHDEFTLEPAKARTYELASFSGSESAGIVELLMTIEQPSVEIINAVEGAVMWFQNNKIENKVYERFINEDRLFDSRIIDSVGAPAIWARFYDLKTTKPIFAGRDGIKKDVLTDIERERRAGYAWYTRHPQGVLDAYPEWKRKIEK